jgi:hypothetical protein
MIFMTIEEKEHFVEVKRLDFIVILIIIIVIIFCYHRQHRVHDDSHHHILHYRSFQYHRYHLGGPLSLRGFAPYGIGPRAPATPKLQPLSGIQNEDNIPEKSNADSLGGTGKSSFLATLSVPVDLKVNY